MPAGCRQRKPSAFTSGSRNNVSGCIGEPGPIDTFTIEYYKHDAVLGQAYRLEFDLLAVPGRKPESVFYTQKSPMNPMIGIQCAAQEFAVGQRIGANVVTADGENDIAATMNGEQFGTGLELAGSRRSAGDRNGEEPTRALRRAGFDNMDRIIHAVLPGGNSEARTRPPLV